MPSYYYFTIKGAETFLLDELRLLYQSKYFIGIYTDRIISLESKDIEDEDLLINDFHNKITLALSLEKNVESFNYSNLKEIAMKYPRILRGVRLSTSAFSLSETSRSFKVDNDSDICIYFTSGKSVKVRKSLSNKFNTMTPLYYTIAQRVFAKFCLTNIHKNTMLYIPYASTCKSIFTRSVLSEILQDEKLQNISLLLSESSNDRMNILEDNLKSFDYTNDRSRVTIDVCHADVDHMVANPLSLNTFSDIDCRICLSVNNTGHPYENTQTNFLFRNHYKRYICTPFREHLRFTPQDPPLRDIQANHRLILPGGVNYLRKLIH